MPVLRLFAAAREAAGEARSDVEGATVGDVLEAARRRYGEPFTSVLSRCRVWVNGQPADDATALRGHDVVAVLPPVSGGAGSSTGSSGPGPQVAAAMPPPPPPVAPYVPPPPPLEAPAPSWLPPPAAAAPPAPEAPAPPPPPPAWSPPPGPPPFESYDEPAWTPSPPQEREWSWTDDEAVEPLPPIEGASPDELLDRLAGLAPRVFGDDAVIEASPAPSPPPPPLPIPPPPLPDDVVDLGDQPAWPAPPPDAFADAVPDAFAEDEPAEEDPDALWGPPSGPVWSVGETDPYAPPEPGATGWEQDVRAAPGERTDARRTEDLPAAPGATRGQEPSDWDRRWDAPTDRGGAGTTEAQFGGAVGSAAPRGIVQPTVRILGPEPILRAASPLEVTQPPPGTVPPRSDPEGRANGAPERLARLVVIDDDVRALTADNGKGGSGIQVVPGLEPPPTDGRVGANGALAAAPAPAVPAAVPDAVLDAVPEAAPDAATAPKRRPKPPPLAVVPKAHRPHGRLGFLWVAVTVAVLVAGVAPVGVWLALCAGIAGLQTAKVWQGRNEKPLLPLAAATAAALPVCAIWGIRAMTAAVAVAVVVTLLARLFSITKAPARDVGLTLAIGVIIGLAVASVVLLRNLDDQAPLLLLAFAAAYDAGAYLVGTGASSAWEGPAAGVASLIPVTMLSAVILVPPFPEGSPLLLGLLAAALAPCGPLVGSALLGERDASASALRRLDSLLVMAPVWSWVAAAFLR